MTPNFSDSSENWESDITDIILPLVAVDHVAEDVPDEVARLLAAHAAVARVILPPAAGLAAVAHELLEQLREARVQVAAVVVVVVAGLSSFLPPSGAHDDGFDHLFLHNFRNMSLVWRF